MVSPIDMNRKEDYVVKATLIVGDSEISGVPCKVYLPERIYETPYVLLKPSEQDGNRLLASNKVALIATVYGYGPDKEIQANIKASEVYLYIAS